jgi:predicted DNA-binding ribbon-helix-helix protein
MKSQVSKRSVVIGGHKTSVSLEDAFWRGLKEVAQGQNTTLSNMVTEIDRNRQPGNLSSAIRLFVLDYFRAQTVASKQSNSSAEGMIGIGLTRAH